MELFAINAQPSRTITWILSWLLFAAGIGSYFWVARERHRENPEDRVVPTLTQMAQSIHDAAVGSDEEAGHESLGSRFVHSMLWQDTLASAKRFLWAMVLLIPAVLLGLHVGLFPYVGVFFLRFILFFDKIIALSVLPILFIAFGIDELSKVMLIVIGVTPTIILDTFNLSKSVPKEQIVKSFTLGAGNFTVAYRVVLKQILPRILNSIRLNLKAVMLFLFAGEMIAATDGLAYRIALLRRNMGMSTIIPYVLWVALLLFLVDWTMRVMNRRLHPWFRE
ncbi:MAG: binding-protein-dependent transport system inner rane component [Bryobacterales bacterium]|nr:binding-protein-dependent transport system inner rane component [Bryobacterales bacterium]